MKILVVEDETMVAMLIEDMLFDMGHELIGPAATVDEAMTIIDTGGFDVALLDLNLGGTPALPIADRLLGLNIPFALVSGYDPAGIEGYDQVIKLQKPFNMTNLQSTVNRLGEQ